jgi:hypothetical protein
MRYYKQGPHDGLCGFVAALNALRFLQRCTGHAFARDDDAVFFDEAVECLARVPGCDLRILKGDPAVGGIDPFQVRDLCRMFTERVALPINVTLTSGPEKMPIAARYRGLLSQNDTFAIIVPYRDGSHWVTLLPLDKKSYRVIDQGRASITLLRGGDGPRLASDTAIILTA